ncbi:hypothetical protein GGI21_005889, partial [Coemansia aciculifera]
FVIPPSQDVNVLTEPTGQSLEGEIDDFVDDNLDFGEYDNFLEELMAENAQKTATAYSAGAAVDLTSSSP